MKQLIRKNIWLIVLLLMANGVQAQNQHVRSEGYWTLGLNGGWAYQQSDAKATSDGYGFGLTLAKNFYSRPNAHLSFDLRGRFLYANTFGLDRNPTFGIENNETINGTGAIDYTTDPGFVFYNHNTQIGELALEGVFHLNRLRERTRFDVSLYGGIGLNYYSTKNNWLDNEGTYADGFTNITLNSNTSNIKGQLENILDDTYETRADGFNNAGKLNFMPSLGVELYYWLAPKFALGLGHRATWSRRDDLDGQIWTNENQLTAENDLYHYTSIGAKWIIEPRRRVLSEPYIKIIDPQINPYNSPTPDGFVRAEIGNASANEVQCFVNDRAVNFNMYGENFTVNFPLREGQNKVKITASTRGGNARADQIIIFQNTYIPPNTTTNAPPSGNQPYIRFTNPPNQGYTSNTSNFTIRAMVENVSRSGDIQVILNGSRLSNFNFDNRNRTVSANVNLRNGQNSITIKARNGSGKSEENTSVVYQQTNTNNARPSVKITQPNKDPFVSRERRVNVEANIKNASRYDISYYINGRVSDNFEYDERRGRFRSVVDLQEGTNKVVIEANGSRKASDQTTIVYERYTPPPPPPPTPSVARPKVRITNVSTPASSNCRTTITATISNVSNRNNVQFIVNGQRVNNFDFNPNTARFQSTLNIERGQNTMVIEGQNQAGRDSDSRQVNCSGGVVSGGNSSKPSVVITTPSQQSSTTNNAKATIKATIKNIDTKNDISFRLNGKRITNFTYNNSTDKFSANVDLKSGNNDILIQATNKLGQGKDDAAIRYIREIGSSSTPKPPKVAISKPSNNSTVTTSTTELKAGILNMPSKTGITVTVNGSNTSDFSYSNGSLNATVKLKLGNNTITVKAKNADGQAQESVTVKYNAPQAVPVVTITKPRNNTTVQTAKTDLVATVKNATKSETTLTVNGKNISSFNFSNGKLTTSVSLRSGNNKIVVKAKNTGGEDQSTINVKYDAPKPAPSVAFTKPRNNATVETARTQVLATVKNASKQDLTFTVNGAKVSSFALNKANFTATVNLKEGKNTLQLKANNAGGADIANLVINYKPKVLVAKPTVKITKPARAGSKTQESTYKIEGIVKNVTKKEDINLKVNGTVVRRFEFNIRSGVVTATTNLKVGKNTIVLTAKNSAGTGSASSSITQERIIVAANPPTVKIESASEPTINPLNPGVARSSIIATIKNVRSKSEITFTVNGKKITNFDFNTRSGLFKAVIDLEEGANVILIKATNEDGTDQDKRTVDF